MSQLVAARNECDSDRARALGRLRNDAGYMAALSKALASTVSNAGSDDATGARQRVTARDSNR